MITSVIYAKEDKGVATIYIPNFFIQTPIDRKYGEDKRMTKIKGVMVNMLLQMYPENMVPI